VLQCCASFFVGFFCFLFAEIATINLKSGGHGGRLKERAEEAGIVQRRIAML
jgi:hypothetical protein